MCWLRFNFAMAKRATPTGRKRKTVAKTPSPQSSADTSAIYQHVCALALALPGVELSTSYGTPAIKVKGKIMARLRSEAEGGLAIRCDFIERQMLLQAAPEAFFLTDHYFEYPMILIRLDHVRRDALPDLVERAWRMVAPKRLLDAHDATKGAPASSSGRTTR
jgi:hypothetical protein